MNRICARMAAALLAAILFVSLDVCAISASRAIVVDGQTGRVLYEKNADEQSLIASTTKIMTALVVCEQCNVLDRMAIPKEAVDESFFDLSSQLAGEVVRKFANYQLRCAVWGDFSGCDEDFLQFMQRQNDGWTFFFTKTEAEAVLRLQS